MKSQVSLATVTVAALLLSIMIRNDPALAADLCPAPSFSAPRTNDAGWKPVCLAIGDFNGDGKLDLAVGNYGAGTVSVLLGNGDGAFQAAVSSPGGSFPQSVVSSDFNGDGKLDLAVVNEGRPWNEYWGKVSVLLGNGNGSFQAGGNYGAGSHPQSIAVGDFNGDGKLDLAVANSGSTNISLLLGNGDGTFQPAVNYGAGSSPYSIAVGDFNGDGRADLAVANSGSTNISVLLGNGDGTFQPAVDYAAGASPYSVALGDFNGDGKLDLAVANFGNPYAVIPTVGTVSVLLGQGDGAFQAAVNYSVGLGPQFVLVGDFNGDGKLDMAVANNGRHPVNDTSGNVSVLLGNGDGTFRSSINYDAGWAPAFLAVGDFDGDGKPDLAINSMGPFDLELEGGPVEVLLNTCACAGIHLDVARGKNAATLSWPLPYSNFGLEATASFNPTIWQTVVEPQMTNNGRCEVIVPLDKGQRYFRLRKPVLGTGLFPQSVVTADSNGDGATALAVTNGYITALLRSECTSAPSPPPPVGKIAVGPDYVIMTVAMGDPLDFQAAQQLATDAVFESLMPSYCALPRHSGIGCVTNRVQWGIETYDAGGNPKVSGGPASGAGFHYCAVNSGYITAVLRGEQASVPPPPPVGVIAVGTDSVIMTLADGDPLDLGAARQLATDAVFESLMRTYCALPRGSGIGFSSGRVQWNVATYDAAGNPKLSGCATSGCDFHSCVVSKGYITALLRSECTSAPSPPPPVGKIAVGPDYVIMTVADGDPLDYRAAQQLVTDAIFESLMPLYCALPRHSGSGCVTNRVQWGIETYDAGGNPKESGSPASGGGFHYFGSCSVTPEERIHNLIVWVNVDAAAGILSNGNSLTTKLGAALGSLGGAKTQAAINELKAFLNEMDTMVKTGRLPAAASQPLIDGAEAIITNLGGQPLRAR